MPKCFFSISSTMDSYYKHTFTRTGLKSSTTDLKDGTTMHCWIPKAHSPTKPNLLLLHGLGSNTTWQWPQTFISHLTKLFNLYVPDLLFFGKSFTSRKERSEMFQAECVVRMMDMHGVLDMHVVGISYGGFVGYSLAGRFPERVVRLVLCCAGVCFEGKDLDDGMLAVKSVDEAASILFPQSVGQMKELLRLSFYKPLKKVPSCFLQDFIDEMCTEHIQERKELVQALHNNRKLSDLPKITQPTLIIWGEHDRIFPLELAHRLKRHLGDNARLVVLKNAGHAINKEKPKEMYQHLKSFLTDPLPPRITEINSNGSKAEPKSEYIERDEEFVS